MPLPLSSPRFFSLSALDYSSVSFSCSFLRAPLPSLCREAVINFAAPFTTPVYHGAPFFSFAALVHRAVPIPNVSRVSSVEPSVASKALKLSSGDVRRDQCCAGSLPPTSFPKSILVQNTVCCVMYEHLACDS
ncbi:unnamed protein product, partial [Pylaiella littoralis]